ncbi:MAG: hypothetical protein ACLP22_11255 [Solirubrobacteraceae bacterium]
MFQAKYHDVRLLGANSARQKLLRDLDAELDKIVNKYQQPCDNYILLTNVPLSSVPGTGTHDRIAKEVAPRYLHAIRHVRIWGYDDICRLLELFGEVRQNYLQFLTPGDVIGRLLSSRIPTVDIDRIVRLYISTDYKNDSYAQLDQAADVGSQSVPLARIFVDLDVVRDKARKAPRQSVADSWAEIADGEGRLPAIPLVLGERVRRVVFIGGPGQGKSTLGQFAAQVHRAALLRRLPETLGTQVDWTPVIPRIPFRIVLRDYAQWIARLREDEPATPPSRHSWRNAFLVWRPRVIRSCLQTSKP